MYIEYAGAAVRTAEMLNVEPNEMSPEIPGDLPVAALAVHRSVPKVVELIVADMSPFVNSGCGSHAAVSMIGINRQRREAFILMVCSLCNCRALNALGVVSVPETRSVVHG